MGARISDRIAAIAESATLAVDAKAKALKAAGRDVIGFGAGEPDFPTPEAIVEAAIRGGRASPVRGTGAETLGLRRNDDVVHAKWGEGVVLDVTGEGDKAEATVHFPSVGDKRLNLSLAPLKRA